MTSCSVPLARGYSVLAHEAVVDTAWPTSIQPLLLARFPGLSPEQLKEAHAYAYGGCIIQDMGYSTTRSAATCSATWCIMSAPAIS
jgi:hypothetical protein